MVLRIQHGRRIHSKPLRLGMMFNILKGRRKKIHFLVEKNQRFCTACYLYTKQLSQAWERHPDQPLGCPSASSSVSSSVQVVCLGQCDLRVWAEKEHPPSWSIDCGQAEFFLSPHRRSAHDVMFRWFLGDERLAFFTADAHIHTYTLVHHSTKISSISLLHLLYLYFFLTEDVDVWLVLVL